MGKAKHDDTVFLINLHQTFFYLITHGCKYLFVAFKQVQEILTSPTGGGGDVRITYTLFHDCISLIFRSELSFRRTVLKANCRMSLIPVTYVSIHLQADINT